MKPVKQAETPPSEFIRRLDSVRMHSAQRSLAKEQMRQAEEAIDFVLHAMSVIRATAAAWKWKLFASTDRERDAYFSGAADRIDLEQRIRNWERRPTSFRDAI